MMNSSVENPNPDFFETIILTINLLLWKQLCDFCTKAAFLFFFRSECLFSILVKR